MRTRNHFTDILLDLQYTFRNGFSKMLACDISGWRTRTVSFVAGPNMASANPHRRNSASASTAASNRVDAVISTACVIPSESVNETEHDRRCGHKHRRITQLYLTAFGVGDELEHSIRIEIQPVA